MNTFKGGKLLFVILCLVLGFTNPAWATWSIIAANAKTGEVAAASATCLPNFDLKKGAGVIVVGKGAAQAQASVDITGINRTTIVNGILAGKTAQEILDDLIATDPQLKSHQYGIVDAMGGAATFTGSGTMTFTSGLTGQTGDIVYAIQGNILTGMGVLLKAEEALVQAQGDLAQKIMAGMNAAKNYGGDGRCSCKEWAPTVCGCPPTKVKFKKEKNRKSAHVGYLVVARIGDKDGVFNSNAGFANGEYYMDLNVTTQSPADPVDTLKKMLFDFRNSWSGHADHILTHKTVYPNKIIADGKSESELMIALADINNERVTKGMVKISVIHDEASDKTCVIGPIIDHYNGVYTIPLTSTLTAGTDVFRVVVDDGMGPVTLFPFPELETIHVSLYSDKQKISASGGGSITLSLDGKNVTGGKYYFVLGSASGAEPGFNPNGINVPINIDRFTTYLINLTGTPSFKLGLGALDLAGKANVVFNASPSQLSFLMGQQMVFSWITILPVDFASTPVFVDVDP